MLHLSKKADYALICLGYLAEHADHVVSAREIAERCQLPLPLLCNLLKVLHQRGIVRSARGASGGYRLSADLASVSLLDLSRMVDADTEDAADAMDNKRLAMHGPAQALQYRVVRFMKDITVADLVLPGRRIDVPLERVGRSKQQQPQQPCKCHEHPAGSSIDELMEQEK